MRIIKFIIICYAVFLVGCSRPDTKTYHANIINFGTTINISVTNTNAETSRKAFEEIKNALHIMNQRWHAWHQSMLTDVNHKFANGQSILIDHDFKYLINTGKDMYHKSHGLFNPAAAKLSEAWGFLSDFPLESREPANPELLAEIMAHHPNMDNIKIEGHKLSSNNKYVKLDVGGYAKGVAMEKMIAILAHYGIHNALLNIGGDITVIGQNNGQPWRIAIRDPKNPQADLGIVELSGYKSIMTSGTYARYFKKNRKTYHHIIDPRTGRPSTGFIAVTVVSDNPILADATATSLMIAGPSQWQEISKSMHVSKILVIDNHNHLTITKDLLKKTKNFKKNQYDVAIL
jgi:thiamine biosynthesis lipoprotein